MKYQIEKAVADIGVKVLFGSIEGVDNTGRNILYIIEGNEATEEEFLSEVMREIIDTTVKYCGGNGKIFRSKFPRICQTLRSVPLKSFYAGFRIKARGFCRIPFVECRIGWGKWGKEG